MRNMCFLVLMLLLMLNATSCLSTNTAVIGSDSFKNQYSDIRCKEYKDRKTALTKIGKYKQAGWEAITITDNNYIAWIFLFTFNKIEVCFGKIIQPPKEE